MYFFLRNVRANEMSLYRTNIQSNKEKAAFEKEKEKSW